MKIIATVTNDLNHDQRMIRICTSLAKAGHKVLLVGRIFSNSKKLSAQPFEQKRLKLFFQKGKLFYLEYNLRLFIFLMLQKFDAVHSVDLDTLMPGYIACRLRHKTGIYDAHEYFTEVPEVVDRPVVKKTWEWVAHFCIPNLKYAITVGESLSQVLKKKYRVDFRVIRNVPFKSEVGSVKKATKGKWVFLYQGALNEGRGLEEVIEAMTAIPWAELWLAGEGDLSSLLRKMVVDLSLDKRIKFLGQLSPNKLASVTLKADLGLNLLKNKGLSYYYSLANKAFDYVQAGLPSVSMAFPEYLKLNDEYEVFVLCENLQKKSIVEAVSKLRFDKEAYQRMSENCLEAAKELNWEKEEIKLLSLYKEVERNHSDY